MLMVDVKTKLEVVACRQMSGSAKYFSQGVTIHLNVPRVAALPKSMPGIILTLTHCRS
jgi:hypothetical protein